MRSLIETWHRLRALLRRRRLEQDLDDELAFHLSMRERDHLAEGADPRSAVKSARRQFGNVTRAREQMRDAWVFLWLEQAVQDEALTVPMRAVARGADGNATALVVGSENKVESRQVKLADAVGDAWIVTEGLRPGERVIVEGLQKVRPGSVVKPLPVETAPTAKSPTAPAVQK